MHPLDRETQNGVGLDKNCSDLFCESFLQNVLKGLLKAVRYFFYPSPHLILFRRYRIVLSYINSKGLALPSRLIERLYKINKHLEIFFCHAGMFQDFNLQLNFLD